MKAMFMQTSRNVQITVILLFASGMANAQSHFDESKRVVLPSEAATEILKRYLDDGSWSTDDWPVKAEDLDSVEKMLAAEFARSGYGKMTEKTYAYYRQYMPARWQGLHLIVVNGFYQSAAEMFPGKDVPADKWKHELLSAFGGGCLFWRAAFVVEKNGFLTINALGHQATLLCNAPK